MKPTLRGAIGAAGAALLVLGLAGQSVGAEAPNTGARWTVARLPVGDANMLGTAAPDAHTVWAVGSNLTYRGPQRTPGFSPLLLAHDDRDGRGWRQVPTAKGVPVRMNGVAAASDRDAWLVGDMADTKKGAPKGGVYTEHWNGKAWSVQQLAVPSDAIGGGLLSVSAAGRSSAWAAGWVDVLVPGTQGTRPYSHSDALLAHWNGKAWQPVALPRLGVASLLSSITAVAPDDVWAVGSVADGPQGEHTVPLALHYDGRHWTVQRGTAFGGTVAGSDGGLMGITAHGRNDVWAVGGYVAPGERHSKALVEHWNGHGWQRVAAPADAGPLTGVAAAPGGVVAVGNSTDAAGDGYALRVNGGRATSLGLPADTATTEYSPWTVGVYRGVIAVLGTVDHPGDTLPKPLVLTARV